METARQGQTVQTIKGITGIVEKVYENSVMIKILKNPTEISYPNMMTIINHKNYSIDNTAT